MLQIVQLSEISRTNSEFARRPYSDLKGVRSKVAWLEGIVQYVEIALGKSVTLDPREVCVSHRTSRVWYKFNPPSAWTGHARGAGPQHHRISATL